MMRGWTKYALVLLALAGCAIVAWDRFGALPDRTEAEFRALARRQRPSPRGRYRQCHVYGECFAGRVTVETPGEFATYDPKLNALIGRAFTAHRIAMDVFCGRRTRPVRCS
jgi:hypothetical protein